MGTPSARVRQAIEARSSSDYYMNSPGLNIFLTIITCGIFGLFLFYQLIRRMRDHNRRRLELLEAANALAWERANAMGLAEELRPNFERVASHLQTLRAMTTDFRDPTVWVLIAIGAVLIGLAASLIVQVVGYILLDGDLIKHDRAEGAAESELAAIYGRLGQTSPTPDPARVKAPQNYGARVIVTILTLGIYHFWWLYNEMVDGNRHFEINWPWEYSLGQAAAALTG